MQRAGKAFLEEALPALDPVISYEVTDDGWRGLTECGEVLEVHSTNGHKAAIPEGEIIVAHQGEPIGRREIRNDMSVDIGGYLEHFNRVVALYRANKITEALAECELTLAIAPTLRARFNRAMVLLAAGRWKEGFALYGDCEQHRPFMRPQVHAALDAGLRPWRGEEIAGKRLLVMHAHGFGDTIQCLRFIPQLRAMGADVVMQVPTELERIAGQCGQIVSEPCDVDFFCPILHLLLLLNVAPDRIDGRPYLTVSREPKWSRKFPVSDRQRIGVAWSVGKPSTGDYPRPIPLRVLTTELRDADLVSVQVQGAAEADMFGVANFPFSDFYDCAAAMLALDEIVAVDTAALHLAGAIGHPKVTGLLSYWSSWRWVASWYANMKLLRQVIPDDWASALAQR